MKRRVLKANNNLPLKLGCLAEGSRTIGTGHIVEALNLARRACANGTGFLLWVNSEAPNGLLSDAPCPVKQIPGFDTVRIRKISGWFAKEGIRTVITNLREVQNEQISVLKNAGCQVICIDEWGRRRLDCDVLVNSSPVAQYHQYVSHNPTFKAYAGLQYLPLGGEYEELNGQVRHHRGPIRTVVVAMGGVDRTGATVRIVLAVLEVRPHVTVHVVIGPGFTHRRELQAALASQESSRVVLHEYPPSLAGLLAQCDVGVTAGGNTLAELACVGTPALVAFEDPHERDQGQAFERMGFGRSLGQGVAVTSLEIHEALAGFDDPEVRQRHCDAGRKSVDGRGALRIIEIASSLVHHDSTVATGSSAE